ncbi:hypothetical protein HNQ07_002149 [Deinococcus metalli]|uniref:Uncharacterized protein n=1 Tax=Deinococcus metalli TaxID=1141878 RepID=A0A7W8NQD4_9DEIO|nr:hypothetical protein [Deinococcus metalli]MBB5376685.1 hypothetical protein [Deinococcus metalli]GHF65894.1 hypothetical protein GCM10017781_47040 [Deinococcus metalli]
MTTMDVKAQQAAAEARHLGDRHLAMKLQRSQEQLLDLLHAQQHDLRLLKRDVKRRRSGGFPWGLVLLIGGGYAAYRSSPAVRDRVQDLMGRLNPGMQGNAKRAGDAVKDGASDVGQGRSPVEAFQRAGGEAQRAGEKAMGSAKDTTQNATAPSQPAGDGVRTQRGEGSS